MKKVLISILTVIFVVSMVTVVNAATGSISLEANSNQVVKGNTFTVTLLGNADENITALQAALSFDETKLSLENKSAGTGFTDASGSNSEIAILSTDNNSLSKAGTLYNLTFKVLDTAEEGTATISVTSATLALVNSSQEQENISAEDANVTITIKADDTTVGNNDTDNDDDNNESNPNTPSTNEDDDSSSKNNDSSNNKPNNSNNGNSNNKDKKLPQTGLEVKSIIAIAILTVFAIISYVSYKKYKNI